MKKSFTVLMLVFSLCLFLLPGDRGRAAPQPNKICSQLRIGCGTCTVDGDGCWVWNTDYSRNCIDYPGPTCDPKEVTINCAAAWFFGGSCSGIDCMPDDCCRRGQLTPQRQSYTKDSCATPF